MEDANKTVEAQIVDKLQRMQIDQVMENVDKADKLQKMQTEQAIENADKTDKVQIADKVYKIQIKETSQTQALQT